MSKKTYAKLCFKETVWALINIRHPLRRVSAVLS